MSEEMKEIAENTEEAVNGKTKKEKKKKSVGQEILEWVLTIVVAVVAALVIRFFIFEPVRVDGHSMDDTLADGEIMFVTKYDYASAWLTLPWQKNDVKENAPRLATGFSTPQRFDVVICRYPGRGDTNFVKRVIGLPGDELYIEDGYLYVNGQKYDEPYINNDYRVAGGSNGWRFEKSRVPVRGDVIEMKDGAILLNGEAFPDDVQYYGILDKNRRFMVWGGRILFENEEGARQYVTEDRKLTVEQDNYLVMGDHRNNSNDSRSQGCITRDMIVGHVRQVLFPFGKFRPVKNGLDVKAGEN